MKKKNKLSLDYTTVENILRKIDAKQTITKDEYLDVARVFSRLYSLYTNSINNDYTVQVFLMNTILQDAAEVCNEKILTFTIADIMDFFIAK